MRTSSTEGTASQMRRASSTSSPVGAPKLVPRSSWACRAASDVGVAPAEDHRPPRRDEVDELVAVGVPHVGAAAAAHEQRVRHADALHGAHRRVDPTGDVALRLVEQALRRVCVHSPPPCDGPRERLVIESTYYCVFARCDGSARFGRSRALVRPVTRWRGGLPRGSGGVLRKRRPPPRIRHPQRRPPPADRHPQTATLPRGVWRRRRAHRRMAGGAGRRPARRGASRKAGVG